MKEAFLLRWFNAATAFRKFSDSLLTSLRRQQAVFVFDGGPISVLYSTEAMRRAVE